MTPLDVTDTFWTDTFWTDAFLWSTAQESVRADGLQVHVFASVESQQTCLPASFTFEVSGFFLIPSEVLILKETIVIVF